MIWLASYPRSGNTYLRMLLHAGFGTSVSSKYDEDYAAFPEEFGRMLGRFSPNVLNIVKTHDVEDDQMPAIYVMRDGRASIISYYRYCRRFEQDRSVESIIRGETPFGSWSAHYRGWDPYHRKNTLFLKFEDIISDPDGTIDQLADFTGLRRTGAFHGDFSTLHSISPDFFPSGSNESNVSELNDEQLELFRTLHGELMAELGYDA